MGQEKLGSEGRQVYAQGVGGEIKIKLSMLFVRQVSGMPAVVAAVKMGESFGEKQRLLLQCSDGRTSGGKKNSDK